MIVVVELSSRGIRHALFNAMFLRTICLARPDEKVAFWADPSHIDAVRPACVGAPGLSFHALRLSEHLPAKIELVSWRRLLHAARALFAIHRRYRAQHPRMVIASGSAAGIFAAYALHRLRGPFVQMTAHGELNTLTSGWRARNPLHRMIDLAAALARCHGERFRYLVLDASVKERLEQLVPALAGSVDTLPIPVNEQEVAAPAEPPSPPPVRIGSLGVATSAKGFDVCIRLAQAFASNPTIAIEHIGRLHPEFFGAKLTGFAHPVSAHDLPREIFVARLRGLHFVCLPLQRGYYELAASATLLDAITYCKPIITTRTRMSELLFQQWGDIGYLCDDEAALAAVIGRLGAQFDPAHYRRQVAAMLTLRSSRTPAALAPLYRATLRD